MKKKIIVALFAAGMCSTVFAANCHSNKLYGQFGLGGFLKHSYSESGPSIFGVAGYGLNKNFAAQGNMGYMGNNQKTVLVEGVWNFVNSTKLTPYVIAGLGYIDMTNNSFGLDAGVGVKCNFSPNTYVFADYRYLQSFGSKMPNGSMLTIGIGIYLGGAKNINSYGMGSLSSNQKTGKNKSHATYALPKDVVECRSDGSDIMRDSIGCYTIDGDKVTMHLDAKFSYNSYVLNAKAKTAIDNYMNFIKEYSIKTVLLQGFASQGKRGPEFAQYNQQLSVNRAEAVKFYMISKGFDGSNIKVVGYGCTHPLLPNITKVNQLINQRVEATIPVPLKAP